MQAITKYIGGHSDVLAWLGYGLRRRDLLTHLAQRDKSSITPPPPTIAASPCADCKRLPCACERWGNRRSEGNEIMASGGRGEQGRTRPASGASVLPGSMNFWKRDFSGSSGVFSIVLRPGPTRRAGLRFCGCAAVVQNRTARAGPATTGLAVAYTIAPAPARARYDHRLVRFSIGLESASDLIADLKQALILLHARLGDTKGSFDNEHALAGQPHCSPRSSTHNSPPRGDCRRAKSADFPRTPDQYGVSTQCAEPVTGSSAISKLQSEEAGYEIAIAVEAARRYHQALKRQRSDAVDVRAQVAHLHRSRQALPSRGPPPTARSTAPRSRLRCYPGGRARVGAAAPENPTPGVRRRVRLRPGRTAC